MFGDREWKYLFIIGLHDGRNKLYRRRDKKTGWLFKELMPFGGKLNDNNRWLKMEELIPWEELEEEYAKIFSQMGRPAKDAQLVIGAICIKHKEGLSDEEVEMVQSIKIDDQDILRRDEFDDDVWEYYKVEL